MTTKKEVATKDDTEIATTDIERAMEEAAKEETSSEASYNQTLSTKNKQFSLGEDELGDELDVVILANMYEHAYYDRPYDPDNPSCPACFAIGDNEKELSPHEDSPDPQSDTCSECSYNQYGSAVVGKGKRCKNNRRLAIAAYSEEDGVDADRLVVLKLAPTSLKNYAMYAKGINAKFKRPSFAVATKIGFDPKVQYPVVTHQMEALLGEDDIAKIMSAKDMCKSLLEVPYDTSEYEAYEEQAASKGTKKSKMS